MCRISRIEAALEKFGVKFMTRVLTQDEMAGHWGPAAAGAALGDERGGGQGDRVWIGSEISFQDIVISRDDKGKPVCTLKGYEDCNVFVSASDDGDYATGNAVIERVK